MLPVLLLDLRRLSQVVAKRRFLRVVFVDVHAGERV
jgi:hypothetical protein